MSLLVHKHLANVQPATFAGYSALTASGEAPHYARRMIERLILFDVRIHADSAVSMYIGLDDSSLGEIPAQLPTEEYSGCPHHEMGSTHYTWDERADTTSQQQPKGNISNLTGVTHDIAVLNLVESNSYQIAEPLAMTKIALVTGGASGIGLALTRHLLIKGWDVVLADIVSPKQDLGLPADRTLFVKTDVSSFDEQAELFSKAFNWRGRLDFAALNAGIAERDDIFGTVDTSKAPTKPDMSTFDVDLSAVYYGIKLFAHYAAQNPVPGGSIVATASAAGLYPLYAIPQYTAAKHGVVGLVRSLAPVAASHNITINAICPQFVVTGLDQTLVRLFPIRLHTDMSVVMQAFDELTDEDLKHTGQIVEACAEGLYYRHAVESDAPSVQELRKSQGMKEWQESIIQMNIQHVLKTQGGSA